MKIKEIEGFESLYTISEDGTVVSLPRAWKTGKGRKMEQKTKKTPLRHYQSKAGYLVVNLWTKNKSKTKTIHRLLANAFIPNPLCLPQVNHKNGIKTDNRLENLEWCSHGQNVQHAYDMGLNPRSKHSMKGERHPSVKLSGKEVVEIRGLRKTSKLTYKEIALLYGVSFHCIHDIIRGRSWNSQD